MSPTPPADPDAAGPGSVTLLRRLGRAGPPLGRPRQHGLRRPTGPRGPGRGRGPRRPGLLGRDALRRRRDRRPIGPRGGLPLHLTVHDDPAFGVAFRSRRYLGAPPLDRARLRLGPAAGGVGRRHRPGHGRSVSPPLRGRIDDRPPGPRRARSRRPATTTGIGTASGSACSGARTAMISSRSWPAPSRRRRAGWGSRPACSSSAGATASSSGPSSPAGSRSRPRATSRRPRPCRSSATASRST